MALLWHGHPIGMAGQVREVARILGRRLRDCVYPPGCAACGQPVQRAAAVCAACWRSIRFIEAPFCAVLGLPFSYDPGAGMVSAAAIANPPAFDRLRAVALYDGAVRDLVQRLKYADRTDLAPMMAAWMCRTGGDALRAADVIVPVPLHRWRLLSRQYNQSAELARAMARLCDRPFLPGVLRRHRATRHQVGLTARSRAENVRGAFQVVADRRDALFGRHVVLVDDVYTTGATVNAATRVLKRAGVAEVTVLTFAMALPDPI